MRLQLLIHRNALPPVTIIYTTGTGPTSHTKSRSSTIADLLTDVNDLVPLESSDGEWGLEDYVVEVAAIGDQELTYECLHFQAIRSVLRDDDEVLIRALSNDDLRVRRLGGRHQITGDGRHLIDGIPFGKRWLRETKRPGIVIAPRKKRRLLPSEDEGEEIEWPETQEDIKRILDADDNNLYAESTALVPFAGDDDGEDDEEDDDQDYTDEDVEENENQVTVSEDFDDADNDAEPDLDLEPSEIQQLLDDAVELEHASNLVIASQVLEKQLKRKRVVDDAGGDEETSFEGFSTAVESSSLRANGSVRGTERHVSEFELDSDFDEDDGSDSMFDEITARQEARRLRNVVNDDDGEGEDDDTDFTSSSDITESEPESDDDSMPDEDAIQQAKQRALNLIRNSDSTAVSDENETSSSGSDVDDDDEVSDATTSSGSDSDSDSDDTSESESDASSESEPEKEAIVQDARTTAKEPKHIENQPAALQSLSESRDVPQKAPGGIPFQGTNRTHQNNSRTKRKQRLKALKQQGLLPQEANFEALARYEAALDRDDDESIWEDQQAAVGSQQVEGTAAKDVAMTDEGAEVQRDHLVSDVNKENVNPENGEDVPVHEPSADAAAAVLEIPETSQLDSQSTAEPAPKRSRLDLASSRRLIFGSLGVRAPKNAEQEQKLREKLSQIARPPKQAREEPAASVPPTPQIMTLGGESDNSWKTNLVIMAVECEEPGGVLPPPPFPFEQGWSKPHKSKRKQRDQGQYYQGGDGWYADRNEEVPIPDVPTLNYDDDASQTNIVDPVAKPKDKVEDLPSEKDIEKFTSLEAVELLPGATIAYQELHVDASTNYQPAVSPYRIGEVSEVDEDGLVHVRLAETLLRSRTSRDIDEETGEKIYGKFEIADEDADEDDDGLRDISFSSMINPKLVRPSSIQVPASSHVASHSAEVAPISSAEDDVALVPESAGRGDEAQEMHEPEVIVSNIDTPRKQEIDGIIKEAGFESALDEQLLQPIENPAGQASNTDLPNDEHLEDSHEKYAHRFRRRSPRLILTSSERQPSSPPDDATNLDEDLGEDAEPNASQGPSIPATSSPYIPTQLTVDYPHISQMEINSSAPVRATNSSSHQDAQKLSPAPALDLSFTVSVPEDAADEEADLNGDGEDNPDSDEANGEMPSPAVSNVEVPSGSALQRSSSPADQAEIEQTQIPQVTSDLLPSSPIPSPDNEGTSQQRSSFLGGPGYDGNESSYQDSDNLSSLPSLSDMMSASRRRSKRSARKESPISPPKRSVRANNRSKKSPTPSSSPSDDAFSQPSFKQSQSQSAEPRLSQIPTGSQVVDLTLSSNEPSPVKNRRKDMDRDSEYVLTGRKKGRADAKTTSWRHGSKGTPKPASQESGIGKRTLLTRKRSSDIQYY